MTHTAPRTTQVLIKANGHLKQSWGKANRVLMIANQQPALLYRNCSVCQCVLCACRGIDYWIPWCGQSTFVAQQSYASALMSRGRSASMLHSECHPLWRVCAVCPSKVRGWKPHTCPKIMLSAKPQKTLCVVRVAWTLKQKKLKTELVSGGAD